MDLITQIWNALWPPTPDKLAALVASMGPGFYVLLFVIVFCETGLVVTPFLPGDSLLFAAGAVASLPGSPVSLPVIIVCLIAATMLGDAVNYTIGYHLGPKVFKYERSWFFNKKHLLKAQAFYEKYGAKTIVLARFVPIVRTFAPFVAGIGRMPFHRFATYSVGGATLWVLVCVLSGYYFGSWEWVQKNFELVLVAIVFISVLPMAVDFSLAWWRKRKGLPEEPPATKTVNHLVAKPVHTEVAAPR